MPVKVAVVGSGIAALAAIRQLLARGVEVTVFDGGERLDSGRQSVVDRMAGTDPADWSAEDIATIRENPSIRSGGGLPKKLMFGSDFIYAFDRAFAPTETRLSGRSLSPTFAAGGYSMVWGGAMLPADDCDIADWPVSRADLAPWYEKVLARMPLCGAGGGTLDRAFPTYRSSLGRLEPGPQGERALADLDRVAGRLAERDMLYGPARLSVWDEAGPNAQPCSGCGLCFAGCPRNSIYSTLADVEDLARRGDIRYRPGAIVTRVSQMDASARLSLVDGAGVEAGDADFDAVFLAAGPLGTTRILLESAGLLNQPVAMVESQKFVVPMLRLSDAPGTFETTYPTIASAFIEAKVPKLSPHWLHVQLTPISDMVVAAMKADGVMASPWGRRLAGPLLRRVMLAWCGMHSNHSSKVMLSLEPARDGGRPVLSIGAEISTEGRKLARRAARHLFGRMLLARSLLLFPVVKFSNPGSGTHCGGSFPMRRQPSARLDTDLYGRPFGWSRVFAVDSSVLPSIPGTTLGLNIMANAARIAGTAPLGS